MPEFTFLPDFPLTGSPLMWFGVLLVAGVLGGELVAHWLRLPRIVGQVGVGVALGPFGLGLVNNELLDELSVFVDVSIGLVLFELGQRMHLGWFRRNPQLLAVGLAESAGAFALIYLWLTWIGVAAPLAAAAAAIGMATSPAVLLRVADDLKAQGQVTERAVLFTAMNSVLTFLVVTLLNAWLNYEYRAGGWLAALAHSLYLLAGSVLLAAAAAWLALQLNRWVERRAERQYLVLVSMIVATVGLALMLKLSVLLCLLTFGVLVKNMDRDHSVISLNFGLAGQIFFVILFVVAGASLEPLALQTAGVMGLAYATARVVGKLIGVLALTPGSGIPLRKSVLLGVSLAPMSGVALIMLRDTARVMPEVSGLLGGAVPAAIVILELLGPVATHFALKQAGEAGREES